MKAFFFWVGSIKKIIFLSSAHSTYLTFSQDSSIIGKFQQKSAQVTIKVKDPQTGVFRVGSGPTSYDELEVPVAYGDSLTLTALPSRNTHSQNGPS